MNNLLKIINSNTFDEDKLYLLESMDNGYGFFYQNGKVYFVHSSDIEDYNSICTSYLDFNCKVLINGVCNSNSFKNGYYDMVLYKSELDTELFDVFYNICSSYSKNPVITFYNFFESTTTIFSIKKEQLYKNLIGLLGELFVIKELYERYNIDSSNSWHLVGTNSKYDMVFSGFNIEIKTTTKSESKFLLKHSQIFNNQNNFIAIVSLIETGEGWSVKKFYKYFNDTEPFSNNIKFQIALAKEINKIPNTPEYELGFALDSIEYYDVKEMPTITNIPGMISDLKYEYDFSYIDEIDFKTIIKDDENGSL